VTPPEVQFWKRVAKDLRIEIEAPFRLALPGGANLYVSALVKHFGRARGMVVDADYSIISPHIAALVEQDFGYCGNVGGAPEIYDRTSMVEVLTDWGWSGPSDNKPDWLP
jgi:hypothetical protein